MKHSARITLILVFVFALSQIMGLWIVSKYIDVSASINGQKVVWQDLPYKMERPVVENESTSFIPIAIALIIGTLLVLLLIKINKPWILKIWFLAVICLTLSFAFAAFMPQMYALSLALIVGFWKMFRPNIFIHNISELFIYGGLAAIFVPLLNVFAAFMLLLFISLYDIIAVWHTKHMVKMAQFQSEQRMFAGLFIPYGNSGMTSSSPKEMGSNHEKPSRKTQKPQTISSKTDSPKHSLDKANEPLEGKAKGRVAVLGGGDMGFPLIFTGVVLKGAILSVGFGAAMLKVGVIPICASIALYLLLLQGEKDKFYPAMPFLSAGCMGGYGIYLLL